MWQIEKDRVMFPPLFPRPLQSLSSSQDSANMGSRHRKRAADEKDSEAGQADRERAGPSAEMQFLNKNFPGVYSSDNEFQRASILTKTLLERCWADPIYQIIGDVCDFKA
eukprot:5216304-Pyramimonas_sp.AAC.1